MIITNSAEKPSNRFIEVVRPYFQNQGYEYNKTKKQFHRPFSKGTQYVGFWFRIGVLTSACINWRFQFEKLEKVYATIQGKPKSYKSSFTLGTDMANYTRWEETPQHTFQLYDDTTLFYDDFSINNAAKKIVEGYEKYTVPYFNQYNDYRHLYEFYCKQDWRQTREIILAKYLSIDDYEQMVDKFQQEVYNRMDKEEMALCEKTIHFLNTQDLKHWLD
jgi:hypothetical protein